MAKGMLAFPAGMRDLEERHREFQADMKELRAAEKRTEASLKAFIDSMRGGNGNGKRKIGLH